MNLKAIIGATVIDGSGAAPVSDAVVLVDRDRIQHVAPAAETSVPEQAEVIHAHGRYIIPGLLDANVHLFAGITLDLLLEYQGRYSEFIEEAAQVTLRAGVTTVFDTWGPLEPLIDVRDRINRGQVPGSRMFVAGNIIGFGGPLSRDFHPTGAFHPTGDLLETETVERINRQWEQDVGPELLWLTPDGVRMRVRDYIERSGIDFVKYAASGHASGQMQFITFSAEAQRAIVAESHRAGLTVQAHTTSPESLRMEIAAGADLLQHGDVTGPQPMPESTLQLIVGRGLPVAALICTDRHTEWVHRQGHEALELYGETDKNDRRLIEAGARLLLTTDGFAFGPRVWDHPRLAPHLKDVDDFPAQLGRSHVLWLEGATERGMTPMDALLSATRNIAEAYHLGDELGTLEPGKRADLVILAADPLTDVRNYHRVVDVMKDGQLVDRDALPLRRVLTEPGDTDVDPHSVVQCAPARKGRRCS